MKPTRFLAWCVAGTVVGLPGTLRAQDLTSQPNATSAGPTVQQPQLANMNNLVRAIEQAPDPSRAVQAYANAKAVDPDNLATEQAYVHRMVELGLPEMVDAQAQDLLSRDAKDGLPWAVVGYLSAKRDQMDIAAADLQVAVRHSPDDPFVQRTAGQIVAWADTRPDQTKVSATTHAAVDMLRKELGGKPEYAQTYQDATQAYRQMAAAGPTSQPSTASATPPTVDMFPTQPPPAVETSPPIYSTAPLATPAPAPTYVYPDTTYYTEPAYPYAWYGPGYYGAWWWPTWGAGVVIVNKDCDWHHHHDGWNGHNGNWNHWNGNHPGDWNHSGWHGTGAPPWTHGGHNDLAGQTARTGIFVRPPTSDARVAGARIGPGVHTPPSAVSTPRSSVDVVRTAPPSASRAPVSVRSPVVVRPSAPAVARTPAVSSPPRVSAPVAARPSAPPAARAPVSAPPQMSAPIHAAPPSGGSHISSGGGIHVSGGGGHR